MHPRTVTALRLAAAVAMIQIGPAPAALPGVSGPLTRFLSRHDHRPNVALTFDDGPHPDGTPAVLDILGEFGVCATFFVVAEQVRQHPELTRRIAAAGHQLGLHGMDHRLLVRSSPTRVRRSIVRGHRILVETTDRVPGWYRPAYGIASVPALRQVRALGMRPVWWTRWAHDWSPARAPQDVVRRLLGSGRRPVSLADVLLLHDSDRYARPGSWSVTAAALPVLLTRLADRGIPVGPLGEPAPLIRPPR